MQGARAARTTAALQGAFGRRAVPRAHVCARHHAKACRHANAHKYLFHMAPCLWLQVRERKICAQLVEQIPGAPSAPPHAEQVAQPVTHKMHRATPPLVRQIEAPTSSAHPCAPYLVLARSSTRRRPSHAASWVCGVGERMRVTVRASYTGTGAQAWCSGPHVFTCTGPHRCTAESSATAAWILPMQVCGRTNSGGVSLTRRL